jgi:hypothetical protein
MTFPELQEFLRTRSNIEWKVDEDKIKAFDEAAAKGEDAFAIIDCMYFRNDNLLWYQENPLRGTKVSTPQLRAMTPDELYFQINKGLDVDQITRITGYMGKVRGFNPGKAQELKDRVRVTV